MTEKKTKFQAIVMNPYEEPMAKVEGKKKGIEPSDLLFMYETHPIVYAVVNKIVKNIGLGGYSWSRGGETVEDSATAEIEKIFTGTQNDQSMMIVLKQCVQDWLIVGDSYLERVELGSRVRRIDHISPKYMRKRVYANGEVYGYGQWVNGRFVTKFEKEEIFTEGLNNGDIYGISPLQAVYREVLTDIGAIIFNKKFFENDATPITHWKLSDKVASLSKDQQEQVKKQLLSSYQGAVRSGKPIINNVVDEVKVIERDLNKFQFTTTRDKFIEKLCSAYDMSKSVIGITDSANESTASQTMKSQFYQTAIRPYELMLERFVNSEVLPVLGFEGYELNIIERDEKDRNEKIQSIKEMRQAGLITHNEARIELGLVPIEEDWANEYQVMTGMGYVPVISTQISEEQQGLIKSIAKIMGR